MKVIKSLFSLRSLIVVVFLVLTTAVGLKLWSDQPLLAAGKAAVEIKIASGSSSAKVARQIREATEASRLQHGVLSFWMRLIHRGGQLKAGQYSIEPQDTPRSLIEKITSGKQSLLQLTIVEGWNWRQLRAALAKAEHLNAESEALDDEQVMQRLGRTGTHPEGRFFPDTYRYAKGSSDLSLLKTAMITMDKQLAAAWESRASDLPLQNPSDVLIMASIIEKETGAAADRAKIGGVFANRLKIGMRLQTDPTVIYGMGESYDGRIRKRDLQTDTPYNTYTRSGLPPTPIAMPGRAALLAAVQPADTKALYFVARGDGSGSSEFSNDLDAHNRAVDKYIRGR